MDKNMDYNDLLTEEHKEAMAGALNTLQTLFDEDINVDDATIGKAMEYLPIFIIEGLLLASLFGIKQEELYAITDWYCKEFNLYAKE